VQCNSDVANASLGVSSLDSGRPYGRLSFFMIRQPWQPLKLGFSSSHFGQLADQGGR
jgi:hypothetical protein